VEELGQVELPLTEVVMAQQATVQEMDKLELQTLAEVEVAEAPKILLFLELVALV